MFHLFYYFFLLQKYITFSVVLFFFSEYAYTFFVHFNTIPIYFIFDFITKKQKLPSKEKEKRQKCEKREKREKLKREKNYWENSKITRYFFLIITGKFVLRKNKIFLFFCFVNFLTFFEGFRSVEELLRRFYRTNRSIFRSFSLVPEYLEWNRMFHVYTKKSLFLLRNNKNVTFVEVLPNLTQKFPVQLDGKSRTRRMI